MDLSPFPHHGPLLPDQVHGRDDLIAHLIEQVTALRVTALMGPRRYGKTSVLRRLAADLESAGTSVVWVDLYELGSMVDMALRFDAALLSANGPVASAISRMAATFGVNLGFLHVEFTKRGRPDETATMHVLLDTLVRAAETTPTLIVLDEFSGVAGVEGAAGLLRTKLQHHYQSVGLVFAGSEPSTMRSLFSEREQPFYGQADLVAVEPLTAVAVHDIITTGFAATGRDAGALPGAVHAFCHGHPRRTMQAADLAWAHTPPGEICDDSRWAAALDQLRRGTADANETLFSSLNRAEQMVLRIVASRGSVWGRAADLLGLNPTPASGALGRLRNAGHLVTAGSDHALVDPVLADWLRTRLPI